MMMNLIKHIVDFSLSETNDLFDSSSRRTKVDQLIIQNQIVSRFTNEFWTSKQRQASSLHEISYRACFKPQLPRFFIIRLTSKGDSVYDPFSGRGTTAIEAALHGRKVIANDVNPLSTLLSRPRLQIPEEGEVMNRLEKIPVRLGLKADIDLSMFYHPETEGELVSLRQYLKERGLNRHEDHIDRWIRMVATNRLTGHSSGFFSVYTLPPNQAVSQESQREINLRLRQKPTYRDTREIIMKKTKDLLRKITLEQRADLRKCARTAKFYSKDARKTDDIKSGMVSLVVTSPPFLDIVDYHADNWLRCWFNSLDDKKIIQRLTISKTIEEWSSVMSNVFVELHRVLKKSGWVAFEVGELRNGKVRLDEVVVPLGVNAGFTCAGIMINSQVFTKTANIWGVGNNRAGTNTNRIVLFRKNS